jgi:hypothetical protein
MLAVAVLFAGASLLVRADEGTKVTIKGQAQCAKCALHETTSCQNVVVVTENGKETKYYLEMNDVSKKAHQSIGFCGAKQGTGPEVKVVGICKKEGEKLVVTPESIEKE